LVFRDFGYQHTAIKESNDRYIDAAPEYMAFMQQYKKTPGVDTQSVEQ